MHCPGGYEDRLRTDHGLQPEIRYEQRKDRIRKDAPALEFEVSIALIGRLSVDDDGFSKDCD